MKHETAPTLLLHSLVVKVSDFSARGPGFKSHLWQSNMIKHYRENQLIYKSQVNNMLIGSTQVLQGHCPLVLLPLVA